MSCDSLKTINEKIKAIDEEIEFLKSECKNKIEYYNFRKRDLQEKINEGQYTNNVDESVKDDGITCNGCYYQSIEAICCRHCKRTAADCYEPDIYDEDIDKE